MRAVLNSTSVWQTKFLWTAIAVLGAVSFGIVALNRGEAVNAAWLVVAAVCVYFIAYRFYGLFVADRALGVDATRPTPAYRHNDGLDYVPTNLWPSLRGDCRRRSTGWSGACRANGLFAGYAVDSRRRGVRRRDPGHDGAVSVDAARRSLAGRYRARRDGTSRWHHRRHRHSPDLRHRPCGSCSRCRQGPGR